MFYLLLIIIILVVWVDLVPLIKDLRENADKDKSSNTKEIKQTESKGRSSKNESLQQKKVAYIMAIFLSLSLIISGLTYFEILEVTTLGVYLNTFFKSVFPGFYELMAI